MAVKTFRLSIILLFRTLLTLALVNAALLSACVRPSEFGLVTGQNKGDGTADAAVTASETATSAATQTETPAATLTPLSPTSTGAPAASAKPTATPTSTSVPQPAALSGNVVLSGDSKKPMTTLVELRERTTHKLLASTHSDAQGKYALLNLLTGGYELWVLITDQPAMPGICKDVGVQGDVWSLGIQSGEDKATTIPDALLSRGLALMKRNPSLKPDGFYAVQPLLKLKPGPENKLDVNLICK